MNPFRMSRFMDDIFDRHYYTRRSDAQKAGICRYVMRSLNYKTDTIIGRSDSWDNILMMAKYAITKSCVDAVDIYERRRLSNGEHVLHFVCSVLKGGHNGKSRISWHG